MFFSQLGCMLTRRLYKDIPPNTPCARRRQLESTIRAVMLCGAFSSTWVPQVLV